MYSLFLVTLYIYYFSSVFIIIIFIIIVVIIIDFQGTSFIARPTLKFL
jgi:hypothetical protein